MRNLDLRPGIALFVIVLLLSAFGVGISEAEPSDTTPPTSAITAPANGAALSGASATITGTADDGAGSGVQNVEVGITPSGGATTWHLATGTTGWSYDWTMPGMGAYTIQSRATDNSGNVETPGTAISVIALNSLYGSPELQHYDWDGSLSGGSCNTCHQTPDIFMPANYRKDDPGFCYSCHNSASVAHDKSLYGGGHSMFANATAAGRKKPTYGDITTGEYNNRPSSRLNGAGDVVCATCHNTMRKTEDYGRAWELTTTGDNLTYTLQNGGWSSSGNLVPKVYRDTTLWGSGGPAYSKTKKSYLVDPSEYTYDESAGTVTFYAQQSPSDYIYVTLDYPYLRASSEGNRLCSDCHAEATHKNANCMECHQSHNSGNLAGIRPTLRTTDRIEAAVRFLTRTGANSFADGDGTHDGVCEVCHTTTTRYRRDGSAFKNHTGGFDYTGKDCVICHTHEGGFSNAAKQFLHLSVLSLTPDASSPVIAGAQVTWTATATEQNCQYQYLRMGPDTGGQYVVEQDWDSSNTWAWTTQGVQAGNNYIQVKVRNQADTEEASRTSAAFNVQSAFAVASLTPSPASPLLVGTSVTWTAAASEQNCQYKFLRMGPDTSGQYVMTKDWSSSNTWTWSAISAQAGDNYVQVNARNQAGTEEASMTSSAYNVQNAALTIDTITPSPVSPVTAGAQVLWTSTAHGGLGTYQYSFWRSGPDTAGVYIKYRDWASANTWTWDTTGMPVGNHYVMVKVRNSDGTGAIYKIANWFKVQ